MGISDFGHFLKKETNSFIYTFPLLVKEKKSWFYPYSKKTWSVLNYCLREIFALVISLWSLMFSSAKLIFLQILRSCWSRLWMARRLSFWHHSQNRWEFCRWGENLLRNSSQNDQRPNCSSFILPIYTSSSLYFLIIASSIDNQFTSALSFNKWLNHSDQIQDYMHLDALPST